MQNELLQQGIELMMYGMVTVIVFLTVLVGLVMLMSAIARRLEPEQQGILPDEASKLSATPAAENDARLLAVITAAVHQYRSRHK